MLLGIAFCIAWLGFTNPVNVRTATWMPDSIPPDWTHWRALPMVLMRTSRVAGPTD
jgi:hypothetical protein